MAQSEKEQDDYRITYYNAVSSKTVDWLWYPYIPYGKITILQGDPGEGKSTMMMQLAALITNGKAMPDGSGDKIPGNVIYQAAEDGIEDTIKPRLEAAGADCSRIAFLEQSDEEPILLNDARLAQAIEGIKSNFADDYLLYATYFSRICFRGHAAETCICICVISKQLVPVSYWYLRDDDC